MSHYLKSGSSCAASVFYAGDRTHRQWIIGTIEKIQSNGKYLVRDKEPSSRRYEHYTVDPSYVAPYPPLNNIFTVGEDILALWYESDEWSTMFYPAKVVNVLNKHEIVIHYDEGSDKDFTIDISKCTKFPNPDEDNPEEDQNTSNSNDSQEKINTNEIPSISEQFNQNNSSSSNSEDKKESNDIAFRSRPTENNSVPSDASDNDRQTGNESNDHSENTENTSLSDQTHIHKEGRQVKFRGHRGRGHYERSSEPEISKRPEIRKSHFIFNSIPEIERQEIPVLDDEEFTALAGPQKMIERPPITFKYDLLTNLSNEKLFPKEIGRLPSTGRIKVSVQKQDKEPKMTGSSPITCGRVGRILSSLDQSPKQ